MADTYSRSLIPLLFGSQIQGSFCPPWPSFSRSQHQWSFLIHEDLSFLGSWFSTDSSSAPLSLLPRQFPLTLCDVLGTFMCLEASASEKSGAGCRVGGWSSLEAWRQPSSELKTVWWRGDTPFAVPPLYLLNLLNDPKIDLTLTPAQQKSKQLRRNMTPLSEVT